MKMLRETIRVLLLTVCCALSLFAQDGGEQAESVDSKNARKVDEFGRLGHCDLNARVQNFFLELNNTPSATGYIIVYNGKDTLPADREPGLMEKRIRDEIVFGRFDSSRVTFIRGGFREENFTQLFVVPNGAPAPEPSDTIPVSDAPEGETYLYDKNGVFNGFYEDSPQVDFLSDFILPSVQAKIEAEEKARLDEEERQAALEGEPIQNDAGVEEESFEVEPPTAEQIEEAKFAWTNERFGDLIKNKKDSSGVLIFYADDAYYDVGKLQNFIEEGKRKIAAAAEISAAKINVVYGGYRESIETEFWLVPKNGKPPAPRPEERKIEETEN